MEDDDVAESGLPKLGTRSSTVSRSRETDFQSPDEGLDVVHDCKPIPAFSDCPMIMGPEEIVERCRYEEMGEVGILLVEGERREVGDRAEVVMGLVPGRRWSVEATSTRL